MEDAALRSSCFASLDVLWATYGEDASRPDLAFVRDGEIVTACQAACPTQAIVFGDLNDLDSEQRPRSQVARQYGGVRHCGLLAELNTRPRLTYLAAVRNPNPELTAEGAEGRREKQT